MKRGENTVEFTRHIAQRVRQARKAANLSQTKLGHKLGVTFQEIQKYEKAVNRISSGSLVLIAQATGQPIGWFFEGIDGTTGNGTMTYESFLSDRDGLTIAKACETAPALKRAIAAMCRALEE